MIDSLNGFLDFIKNYKGQIKAIKEFGGEEIDTRELQSFTDELFCPKCGDARRCNVICLTWNNSYSINSKTREIRFEELPYLFKATCLQCGSETLLLIYNGPTGIELAVLHNTYSGCITPNSPVEVKYYIDQAYRSRSVGAISAAMAMYRSALEWLLYDQGFTDGMLGKKIGDLEKSINEKTAPKWANEINPEFLEAIKNIGNGAMHTNGGDITKQNNIDKNLLELVDIVFAELLDKIYEQPLRSANNLAKLRGKVAAFK
jgi:hypothetical protein